MIDSATPPEDLPHVRAHGARIPSLGLGTWQVTGRAAQEIVERALELGYRHLDTAQAYGNEGEIGRALERSGVDRDEVFVTTKVWPDNYRPADFRASVEESLRKLRISSVDLLLLHWPAFGERSLESTVELLAEAHEEGRTRHIGLSNFTPGQMERASEASSGPLVVNQVEYHPFLAQDRVLEAVRSRGMALTAYCPLAQGRTVRDPLLRAIGEGHGKTGAQVALRWLLQQDPVAAIPRTSDPGHLAENLEVFDFDLTKGERDAIAELAGDEGRIIDPAGLAPDWER